MKPAGYAPAIPRPARSSRRSRFKRQHVGSSQTGGPSGVQQQPQQQQPQLQHEQPRTQQEVEHPESDQKRAEDAVRDMAHLDFDHFCRDLCQVHTRRTTIGLTCF